MVDPGAVVDAQPGVLCELIKKTQGDSHGPVLALNQGVAVVLLRKESRLREEEGSEVNGIAQFRVDILNIYTQAETKALDNLYSY